MNTRVQVGGTAAEKLIRTVEQGHRPDEVAARAACADRHVLVIGGAGYVGNVLTRKLLTRGYRVRCLDVLFYRNGGTIAPLLDHPRFSFVHGDLRDPLVMRQSLHGVTDVVLLAALVGDPISKKYPDIARDVNLKGAQTVFGVASESHIDKFVFTSTCSNYGIVDGGQPATETAALNPKSIYAETKVAFEDHILEQRNGSLCPTILRIATAFGLSPRMRFDLTISEFTRQLALGRDLVVYDEKTWRPYCHVADISEAITTVLEAPRQLVNMQVFNVGADTHNYTKEMIVDEIVHIIPQSRVRYREGGADPRNYRVSFEKIRSVLGFAPGHSVAESVGKLRNAIDWGLFSDVDERQAFYANQVILA
jgi:nucleoside-diphosphate-sugar epimerase